MLRRRRELAGFGGILKNRGGGKKGLRGGTSKEREEGLEGRNVGGNA